MRRNRTVVVLDPECQKKHKFKTSKVVIVYDDGRTQIYHMLPRPEVGMVAAVEYPVENGMFKSEPIFSFNGAWRDNPSLIWQEKDGVFQNGDLTITTEKPEIGSEYYSLKKGESLLTNRNTFAETISDAESRRTYDLRQAILDKASSCHQGRYQWK